MLAAQVQCLQVSNVRDAELSAHEPWHSRQKQEMLLPIIVALHACRAYFVATGA